MSSPIPMVLFGKFPGHRQAVTQAVKPDFEVVETCSSTEEGKSILERHFADGSIKLVAMGGGFSHADYEAMRGVSGGETVSWFRPWQTKPDAAPGAMAGGPPSAEAIAERVRKALDEHKSAIASGEAKGEVFWF